MKKMIFNITKKRVKSYSRVGAMYCFRTCTTNVS